jgi:hypothetical protein
MPYRANPFLERMSERTTSDQEFVRLFSPKILERLAPDAWEGAVHIFRSPPGGGKTTLLRAFTPTALRAFWNARYGEMSEAFKGLVVRNVLHEENGPLVLGVFLSCASGYADLPPGATITKEGLFRALLDCRIVLRTLRSLMSLMGYSSPEQLDNVRLEYQDAANDLKSIPIEHNTSELLRWAEQRERGVYVELDSILVNGRPEMLTDIRFEGVLWLQSIRFIVDGTEVAPKRLLMIDDLHKLRRKQRTLLIEELVELRPTIPVWLAERSIALGEQLLAQGAREGRELREYALEDVWSGGQHQFATYAQNILDRRLDVQNVIPSGAFVQYLRDVIRPEDARSELEKGIDIFRRQSSRYRSNPRYAEWLQRAEDFLAKGTVDAIRELYVTLLLIARDEGKRQLSLELGPLPTGELQQRDSSQVQAAADIFINNELKVPYYYGIDRLCVLATGNVEELLSLAAALYDGLLAKRVLRKDLLLSPQEQERLLKEVARRKRDFIPKNHTEGARAQRLLDAIGSYCRERTFLPNAPYAPGVTGVRLSVRELERLKSETSLIEQRAILGRVLAECVAENLLFTRDSSESTSRERGTIFYLNRTLCMHYGLPLQLGGWQDISIEQLTTWMDGGRLPSTRKLIKAG